MSTLKDLADDLTLFSDATLHQCKYHYDSCKQEWYFQTSFSHIYDVSFVNTKSAPLDYNPVADSLSSGASSSADHGSTFVTRVVLDRWGERILSDQRGLSAEHNAKLDHILSQHAAHNIGQTNASEDPGDFEMEDS